MILQNHKWLPVNSFSVKIDALGSLKQVTGMISKLVGASYNFEVRFFIK
jgi:hypothetical protein